jgi:hypothetical protein
VISPMDKLTIYHIRVNGHFDAMWTEWFEGLTITNLESGEALISGPLADQAALQGLLNQISNLGLPLISVNAVTGES